MKILKTLSAAAVAGGALAAAAPASATTLLGFTDHDLGTSVSGLLSDDRTNWAAGWSQSAATSNVTVRILVTGFLSSSPPAAPANWWITTALGRGADADDVVASGTYVRSDEDDGGDFNTMGRITLATGLSFGPGTYFLVLDGSHPEDQGFASKWVGDDGDDVTVHLADGFAYLGDFVTGTANNFGPSSLFTASASTRNVFELETPGAGAPEPAAWALMIAGFGLAGARLRRRGAERAAAR